MLSASETYPESGSWRNAVSSNRVSGGQRFLGEHQPPLEQLWGRLTQMYRFLCQMPLRSLVTHAASRS